MTRKLMLVRRSLLPLICLALICGCRSTPELTAYGRGEWKAHPNVKEEFRDAAVVFVGKVTGDKILLDRDDFIIGNFYSIRVGEIFKGTPGQMVELYGENSSGRFPMKVGQTYLIFAREQGFEGVDGLRLAINACGNSATLNEAAETLRDVRKLKK